MNTEKLPAVSIHKLKQAEEIPYDLLLLADPYQAAIDKYLSASEIYIASLSTKVIGLYVLYPAGAGTIEIKNIAVEESLQGKGIGKQMLGHAAEICRSKGIDTLIIGTANSSIGQLFLYQQQGFEIFDIKRDFFLDNYIEPIFEDGIQCKHMIMLKKKL